MHPSALVGAVSPIIDNKIQPVVLKTTGSILKVKQGLLTTLVGQVTVPHVAGQHPRHVPARPIEKSFPTALVHFQST